MGIVQCCFGLIYSRFRGVGLDDESLPSSVILEEVVRRSGQLLRGLCAAIFRRRCSLFHFRGADVKVRNPSFVEIGRFVVLGDRVELVGFSKEGVVLEDRVSVARGACIAGSGVVSNPGVGVRVGARTSIGANNVIWGQGGVYIGRDCLFGPGVVVVSENHVFDDPTVAIWKQGARRSSISIGDGCWLGAGVVVTAGVSIGVGCVVGANAVVTEDLPDFAIAVGVPARVVRVRV